MSHATSKGEVLDTVSDAETFDTDSDVEPINAVNGSCPCCGYEGELTYIDEPEDAGARPSRKRKRRRSKSPASQQFMRDLALAIEQPRTQPASIHPHGPWSRPEPVDQPKIITKNEPSSYIQKFFSQYPEYAYDPAGETMSQFQQMSQLFNWKREDPELKEAQQQLRIALTEDFNRIYGRNVNSLASWQSLCRVLQLPEVPDDLARCREIVKATFVNLVDLVDTQHTEQPVRHFENEAALRKYSRKKGKIFPKEEAYAGGLLKHLLRRIFSSGPSSRPQKRRRKGP